MGTEGKGYKDHPTLIVGQGLAGSVLALTLHRLALPCMVVDAGTETSASAVAAGIFNPVTGKRMQLTWLAEELFAYLPGFYRWVEQLLGTRFFYDTPNVRPLFTEKDRQDAEKLVASGPLAPWVVVEDIPKWAPTEALHAPYGYLRALHSGYVDVPALLAATTAWLSEAGCLQKVKFDYDLVEADEKGITYQGMHYSRIVFAEGISALQNPYLHGIALRPLKGEILHVKPKTPLALQAVANRAGYLAPRTDGTLWAGATYQHSYADGAPTQAGREDILQRIAKFCRVELEVTAHQAGLRPSTADRRPIVGPIHGLPNGYVFNGLGTKGVSLAPYLAMQLADGWLQA